MTAQNRTTPSADGSEPDPIRFFGTSWVAHDAGYVWRRAAVAVGGLVGAVAGALLLRLGYQGLAIAKVGGLVNVIVVVGVAVCTALAFRRTWEGFTGRAEGSSASSSSPSSSSSSSSPPSSPLSSMESPSSAQTLMLIGFIGVFLAWSLRALQEAPGEKLRRQRYEERMRRGAARRATRGGK
ncbi:EamA/RhaT family transporter [Streptomyces sp. URMC 126]|uniref:EamA/RhaT family transporter n=1 Tax=Streptomyces sp. URMC 126 TaxID=3423401 RepID=UPI003F199C61